MIIILDASGAIEAALDREKGKQVLDLLKMADITISPDIFISTEHQHSKLGYVTPQQRRTGTAEQIYAQRNHTILMAKQKHPLRWRTHKVRYYGAVPVTIVCRPLIQKELF